MTARQEGDCREETEESKERIDIDRQGDSENYSTGRGDVVKWKVANREERTVRTRDLVSSHSTPVHSGVSRWYTTPNFQQDDR